jgi:hypothetical protein
MSLKDSLTGTRLKATALALAASLGGPGASAQVIFKSLVASTKEISPETVQALEKQVIMPADAAPLTSYDRYYAPGVFEKRDVIVGVFLKRPSRVRDGAQAVPGFLSAFTTTVEKLPRIKGGSCTVVTIYFDTANGRFIKLPVKGKDPQLAVCNPLA